MDPPDRAHIALVGLSGTGKSTVAPLLADRRGMLSVDLDRMIATERGMTAAEMFAADGEDAFRDLEERLLEEALNGPPTVLATGGGVVERARNRTTLRARACVVWLQAPPDMLEERMRGSAELRPLLTGDPVTALRRMARERESLYREVADLAVDVSLGSPREIARDIDREITDD